MEKSLQDVVCLMDALVRLNLFWFNCQTNDDQGSGYSWQDDTKPEIIHPYSSDDPTLQIKNYTDCTQTNRSFGSDMDSLQIPNRIWWGGVSLPEGTEINTYVCWDTNTILGMNQRIFTQPSIWTTERPNCRYKTAQHPNIYGWTDRSCTNWNLGILCSISGAGSVQW